MNRAMSENLYETLRNLRNQVFDHECYYGNETLQAFAFQLPRNKQEMLEIDSDTKKYDRFGWSFLAVIQNYQDFSEYDQVSEEAKLYVLLGRLERALYSFIQRVLSTSNESWWLAVPKAIRTKAAVLHEESQHKISREHALTLTDLHDTIAKNWASFSPHLVSKGEGKPEFKKWMCRVGEIRNRVCHPLRLDGDPVNKGEMEFIEDRLQYITLVAEKTKRLLAERSGRYP